MIKFLARLFNFITLGYTPLTQAIYKSSTVEQTKNIFVKNLIIPSKTFQILKRENPNLEDSFNFRFKNDVYNATNLNLIYIYFLLPVIRYVTFINIIFSKLI